MSICGFLISIIKSIHPYERFCQLKLKRRYDIYLVVNVWCCLVLINERNFANCAGIFKDLSHCDIAAYIKYQFPIILYGGAWLISKLKFEWRSTFYTKMMLVWAFNDNFLPDRTVRRYRTPARCPNASPDASKPCRRWLRIQGEHLLATRSDLS